MVSWFLHPFFYWMFCLLLCIGIFYTATDRAYSYLTPDSTEYLAEASRINQNGFIKGIITSSFTKWPLGYPVLIAVVSGVTSLEVATAAKLLNIVFLALTLWLLFARFGTRALLPALLFAQVWTILLYRYTWSEGMFLFFEVAAFMLAEKLTKKSSWLLVLGLGLCCICLFLTRYIGVFIFPWLLYLLYTVLRNHNNKLVWQFSSILMFCTIVVALYAWRNIQLCGYVFGLNRGADTNGFAGNVTNLFQAIGAQCCFMVKPGNPWWMELLVIQILLLLVCWRFVKVEIAAPLIQNHTKVWLSGALIYGGLVIALRFFIHYDALDYRLLLPAVLPLTIAGLQNLSSRSPENYSKFLVWLLGCSALSFAMNFLPYMI